MERFCTLCGVLFETEIRRSACDECRKMDYKKRRGIWDRRGRTLYCVNCGEVFTAPTYLPRLCRKCYDASGETAPRWDDPPKAPGKPSISEIARLAREAGMTYGQYVSREVQHGL